MNHLAFLVQDQFHTTQECRGLCFWCPLHLKAAFSSNGFLELKNCMRTSHKHLVQKTNIKHILFCSVLCDHTLATCRDFWCSIPPCSLKPQGAPPDRVMITSSATMMRSVLVSLVRFSDLGALSTHGPCYYRAPSMKTTTTATMSQGSF